MAGDPQQGGDPRSDRAFEPDPPVVDVVDTNLLTHQIATLIQELATGRFQGEAGFAGIVKLIDEGLATFGSDVRKAGLSEFRKLYHTGWKSILETVCETSLRETLTDRFKKLVF
jgi:hypothetical protein